MAELEPSGESSSLPTVREDLVVLTGYHSPQLDVEVRLNTNESPLAPPAEWFEALGRELASLDVHRYPDRQATALRAALADCHRVRADQVFCANGSNEVLQCLLLAYGGPGRTVALFEPTYTLHRHIARLTGTEVAAGRRTDAFGLDFDEVRRVVDDRRPVDHLPVLTQQPDRPVRTDRGRAEGLGPGSRIGGGGRGLRAVRPHVGLDLITAAAPGSERVVVVRTFSKTWAMAGLRLGYLIGATRGGRRPARRWPCPITSTRPNRRPAVWPCGSSTRWRRGWPCSPKSGDGSPRRWPNCPSRRGRRTPISSCSGRKSTEARQVWNDLLDASVLVRDCSGWPGLEGCLRVTVGLPPENDRFLAALSESLR